MSQKPLKVYFLGSARIAVTALDKLFHDPNIEIVGIGTQLDKPKGRKKRLTPTPVGEWALQNDYPIDKIQNINNDDFYPKLEDLDIDFMVVIAFGQLLKPHVLDIPKIACINVHASILPDYRGASPIATCLLNGDKETGVAIMKMEKGLDSGPVFQTHKLEIPKAINAYDLETELATVTSENIVNDLISIATNKLNATEQDHDKATFCHKISKEDGVIDFRQTASEIIQKIQAFTPWPGAQISEETAKGRKVLQIVSAQEIAFDNCVDAGTIVSTEKRRVIVACAAGTCLEILRVIPQGKKEMPAADCRNGGLLRAGTSLL